MTTSNTKPIAIPMMQEKIRLPGSQAATGPSTGPASGEWQPHVQEVPGKPAMVIVSRDDINRMLSDIRILKRKCEQIAAMNENLLRKVSPSGDQPT